ncbi:hypothetical protein L3Q82_004865 [Scortum barcoo]|uniref:Uncharacterized protein n=1 Tax=Scortum barcoo TaxID=214431 RepID=A0ACB8VG20_9TELE|nr:hypothetical protein L3Q82_004865 [Scortum barcoo]
MTKKGFFGFWFCLLMVGFLVWPGLAQVPEPAQCLVSGIYKLVRPPYQKSYECWKDCSEEPDCHMAVVAKPLNSFDQCLLVNCLNQGNYSYRRDPSTQISVYPKNNSADVKCYEPPNDLSCQSEIHRFFYNSTSFKCERHSDCSSNRNGFDTQEGCETLCNEKFRCYRPMQYGSCSADMPKFFYNISSQRCERFSFSSCGSNGNIFGTEEECQSLCGGVKDNTVSPPTDTVPAKTTATTTNQPAVDTAIWFVVLPVGVLLVVAFVMKCSQRFRRSPVITFFPPCPPSLSLTMPILKNLPVRLKGKGGGPTLENALILRRMSLNITPTHHHHNPFDNDDDSISGNGGHGNHWSPGSSLLDGDGPRDRNPFEDEEDENEANEGKKGIGGGGRGSVKGSLKFKSPLKTLGKLGKNLRMSARSKGSATPSPQGSLQGTPSPGEKKKRGRRSSEGSLLRFAGKYRENRKESLTNM